jgi:hypothetical protein
MRGRDELAMLQPERLERVGLRIYPDARQETLDLQQRDKRRVLLVDGDDHEALGLAPFCRFPDRTPTLLIPPWPTMLRQRVV